MHKTASGPRGQWKRGAMVPSAAVIDGAQSAALAPAGPETDTSPEEKAAFRRAIGVGLIVWPSFFLLDAYMALVAVPGAPLGLFLVYRLAFELVLVGLWWLGRRPGVSGGWLRGALRVMAYGAAL